MCLTERMVFLPSLEVVQIEGRVHKRPPAYVKFWLKANVLLRTRREYEKTRKHIVTRLRGISKNPGENADVPYGLLCIFFENYVISIEFHQKE